MLKVGPAREGWWEGRGGCVQCFGDWAGREGALGKASLRFNLWEPVDEITQGTDERKEENPRTEHSPVKETRNGDQ